ncbi:hypothetical protein QFC20_000746 [Naganishia adeliensis]|uniref:Uncharacterized protein n=1 Tax=Naganishia adeliensis TaxID=92952 RepID=A0ACC2WX80_9TREE|nr:hypothetical protein QFC20_000746 [Naganishia adeliensis]
MAQMGINTVRLPVRIYVFPGLSKKSQLTYGRPLDQVGYWSVGRANCHCEDTPFWPYIEKYDSQWSYEEKAISWAAQYQIGVLIDFHGAEGSQNGWEHAGIDLKKATFLDNKSFKEHTSTDESTLNRLRPILGDDFSFYISGSISDPLRIDWIRRQPGFIVMDYHVYPVFDSRYKRKSAQQQIDMMNKEYTPLYEKVSDINLISKKSTSLNISQESSPTLMRRLESGLVQTRTAKWTGTVRKPFATQRPAIAGIHYWSWKTQGDWFNTWSFLSSSGGPDGFSRIGNPDDRPLLVPANGQNNFWPTSSGMSAKGPHKKRNSVVEEAPDAVEIWDEGCRTAQEFADYGAR